MNNFYLWIFSAITFIGGIAALVKHLSGQPEEFAKPRAKYARS
jgi:hypothetical protein